MARENAQDTQGLIDGSGARGGRKDAGLASTVIWTGLEYLQQRGRCWRFSNLSANGERVPRTLGNFGESLLELERSEMSGKPRGSYCGTS